MPLLADSTLYVGSKQAAAAYYNGVKVWPKPPSTNLTGWRFLYNQDFNTPATLGNDFANKYPGFTGYTGRDTSGNGTYDYSKTLTVHDSLLDWYVHTENGTPYVAAPTIALPTTTGWGQTYGRYSLRFRTETVPGYKLAWLLWPAEPNGWSSGEIDFPEGDLGGDIQMFSHEVDGNPSNNAYGNNTGVSMTDWHITTIEWTPTKLSFYLDNKLVGSTTAPNSIPHVDMYWALQVETSLSGTKPAANASGHVYLDWVAAWAYNP